MKAMILAAGLGTRLRPLTLFKPKPLIPIANIPIIERVINHLKKHGVDEIIVNTHHHHDQLSSFLDKGQPFGIPVTISFENEILGTGGGLKKTMGFWDSEPFFLVNSDILTDIDLSAALKTHRERGAIATLILHDYQQFNKISIDKDGFIMEIPREPPSNRSERLAFTGIHVIERGLLDHITGNGFSDIIDCYRHLLREKIPVAACLASGHNWRDVGNIESYIKANREALGRGPFLFGKGSKIDPSARLSDWAVIGEGAVIEAGVRIKRSVIWKNATIERGRYVIDSIITGNEVVVSDLENALF